jgi:hypothetical protein
MPQPLDYVNELKELDASDRKLILRDNALALNERLPA